MDQLLNTLDAKLQIHMRVDLKKLHRRLCPTAAYVTHDQEEAITIADSIAVPKDGNSSSGDCPRRSIRPLAIALWRSSLAAPR